MKRTSVLALGLNLWLSMGVALLLSIGGCGNNTPSNTNTVTSSSAASLAAPSTAAAPSVANTEVTPTLTEQAQEGEQVTETGSAESVEASSASSQSLALRITEQKPEPASQWKEGVHYRRLVPTQPTSAAPGQVEVTEVFWYGCPHCYALDPYLENWRKNGKAAYVSFVRVPVMWSPGHQAHARMFYTAELLGKLEELHTEIFREMQVNGNAMNSPALIEKFFTSHGVSQADFQKAFSSFAVEASLKRAATLGLSYKVDSVPLIVINGKYVTDVGRAGNQQQLIALINELAARERS